MTKNFTRPELKWSKQAVKEGCNEKRGKDLLANYCRKVSKLSAVFPRFNIVIAGDTCIPFFAGHGMHDAQTEQQPWLTNDARLSYLGVKGIQLPRYMDSHAILTRSKKPGLLGHRINDDMCRSVLDTTRSRGADPSNVKISKDVHPLDALIKADGEKSIDIAILNTVIDQQEICRLE